VGDLNQDVIEVRTKPSTSTAPKRRCTSFYSSPAGLIRHTGQIVLKIYGKIGKILEEAHWKLLRLHMMLE
jgi:hypothetical protein